MATWIWVNTFKTLVKSSRGQWVNKGMMAPWVFNSLWPGDNIWPHRAGPTFEGYGLLPDSTNQATITCTNFDFLSEVFRCIHLRAISQDMIINFICVRSEMTLLRLLHLPWNNELKHTGQIGAIILSSSTMPKTQVKILRPEKMSEILHKSFSKASFCSWKTLLYIQFLY